MTNNETFTSRLAAWLVATSGEKASTRYRLRARRIRIGREPDHDLVPEGPIVNGTTCRRATLRNLDKLQLGIDGPEFEFRLEESVPQAETLVAGSLEEFPDSVPESENAAWKRFCGKRSVRHELPGEGKAPGKLS